MDDDQSVVTLQYSQAVKAETRLYTRVLLPSWLLSVRRRRYIINLSNSQIVLLFLPQPVRRLPLDDDDDDDEQHIWFISPYSHSREIKVVAPSPSQATSVSPRSPWRVSSAPASR